MKVNMFAVVIPLSLLIFGSCSKDIQSSLGKRDLAKQTSALNVLAVNSTNPLIAYKNSPHQIAFGWAGQAYDGSGITGDFEQLPDSLDIVSTFLGDLERYPLLTTEIPVVQSTKGTKFVINIFSTALPSGYPGTAAGIVQYANDLKDSVNKYGLDGLILDYEPHYQGVPISQLFFGSQANMSALVAAVGKYYGPTSNTGKILAVSGEVNFLADTLGKYLNYGIEQAYNSYGATDLESRYETMKTVIPPSKLIVVETFEGTNWQTGGVSFTTANGTQISSSFLGMAAWNPTEGNKGGIGAWHMELDHQNTPVYKYYREAIQLMNPASAGVVFYQNINYGGASSLPFPKGNYIISNFATYNMVNDWASSVKIPTGWTVTIYSNNNYSGTSWTLTADNSWLGALSPSANDVISSFKIQ